MLNQVPLALTLSRVALAPVVVWLALDYPSHAAFGVCLTVAFLSDVFDGIIARRLKVATAKLRRLDSAADTLFYLAATFAAWRLHPQVLLSFLPGLIVLVALELLRYGFDWQKFGREASYHMWSSKLWGIALFVAFLSLLAFNASPVAVGAAIVVGIIADLEGLAISMLLKNWQADVPTIVHAWRIRAGSA